MSAPLRPLQWALLVIQLFIQIPIFWYLGYRLLEMSEATQLDWFLFWVYIPLCFVVSVTVQLCRREWEKKE